MKKKKLKSLNLNKRSISSFKAQSVNGGSTPVCTLTTTFTPDVASWILDCLGDEDPIDIGTVNSSACADTQNDDSCQCTIA